MAEPSPPILITTLHPSIIKITLNRPQSLNAINAPLLSQLVAALHTHRHARVIILEGAGDRSFCAGEDLKQTLTPSHTGTTEELRHAFDQLQSITRLTSCSSTGTVVIAAVQGFAIGGGAEIALAADFVIGGPGARFRFPEVTLGHAATGGITARLSAMIGLLRAKELLITGRWVDSEEALRWGMLNEVCEDPKKRAVELALQLAGLPAAALAESKMSVERGVLPDMERCLQDEVGVASYCFAQNEADEAFEKFRARKGQSKQAGDNKDPCFRDINSALAHAVQSFPDKTFLRFVGRDDLTFAQAYGEIAKLAGGLKEHGIEKGDRVMAMMRNSPEMVCLWMATNRLGAVWVPINVEIKSITLKHVVEASQPKLAIVDDEFANMFHALGVVPPRSIFTKSSNCTPETAATPSSTKDFSHLCNLGAVKEPVQVTPSTTAAFLYTSGTTGKSKPCILSHEYFILQAQTLISGCGLLPSDILYCPFPLFHADATALTTIPAILLGATAALSQRFSASRFWDEVRETGATVYDFMGATLALTWKQPLNPVKDRDHKVRLAWGVPVPQFASEYEKRFGHELVTLYGSVEASLPIFQDRSHGSLPTGSCGRLRPGHQSTLR